jgi:hypothetical protein
MDNTSKLQAYYNKLVFSQEEKVQKVLNIGMKKFSFQYKLFALSRYLHNPQYISGKKSRWPEVTSVSEFKKTAISKNIEEKCEKVNSEFINISDSGYSLTWTGIRTLDHQIELFDSSSLKGETDRLFDAAISTINSLPDSLDYKSIQHFKSFLKNHKAGNTLAAPGLSDHGKMNAVDFIVMKGSQEIAGTHTVKKEGSKERIADPVWRKTIIQQSTTVTWEEQLMKAIKAADVGFEGPLKPPGFPDEPWHYILKTKFGDYEITWESEMLG